ncbi:hypothetical protein L596_005369 [Steinernema carpocapsae]|uniref:Uncharacterized protein n=1 Tax=Steinernema carpocapsae TaxID=34508 RepID=A0A4U8V2E9_STECR|nr:hypothetical protein L596_005369 [Steinernema carpocapsae]
MCVVRIAYRGGPATLKPANRCRRSPSRSRNEATLELENGETRLFRSSDERDLQSAIFVAFQLETQAPKQTVLVSLLDRFMRYSVQYAVRVKYELGYWSDVSLLEMKGWKRFIIHVGSEREPSLNLFIFFT